MDKELHQAWGDWLSRVVKWEWFVTLTLRDPKVEGTWTKPGFATAKRAWGEFVARGRPALGELTWVRFFELHRDRQVPHVHALVADCDPSVRRMDLVDWAYGRWGITRVLPYNHELGAAFYLGKYITKDVADVDFSKSFPRAEPR